MKLGISFAVIYWIIATIRSTVLIEESGFFNNLINPGGWDLLLRLITVIGIIALTIYLHLILKRQTLETLNINEQLSDWQFLIEAANSPIIELDSQLRIKKANKAAAILTGYNEDDLIMQDFAVGLFQPEDHQQIKAMLSPSYIPKTREQPPSFKLKAKRLKNCHINLTTSIITSNDEAEKILVFLKDVSAHVTQQETAKNRLKKITNLIHELPFPIALFNQSEIKLWNNSIAKLTNITTDDINIDTLTDYVNSLPNHEQIFAAIEQVNTDQKPISIDVSPNRQLKITPDGTDDSLDNLIWIEDTSTTQQLNATIKINTELESQIIQLENNKRELTRKYDDEKARNDSLTSQINQFKDESTNYKSHHENIERQLTHSQQQTKDLNTHLSKLNTEIENAKLPVFRVNKEAIVINTNQTAKELLGLEPQKSLLPSLATNEQRQQFKEIISHVEHEKNTETELEFYRDNHAIFLNCHIDMTTNDEFLVYGHDITSFHRAQRELALSLDTNRFELNDLLNEIEIEREKMNVIMSSTNEGIIVTDVYNRVTKMNPAAEDFLGIRLSQAVERPIHFVIRNQDILEHLKQTIHEKLQDHKFTLYVPVPGDPSSAKLAFKTTIIQDRDLQDQGVIIKLTNITK